MPSLFSRFRARRAEKKSRRDIIPERHTGAPAKRGLPVEDQRVVELVDGDDSSSGIGSCKASQSRLELTDNATGPETILKPKPYFAGVEAPDTTIPEPTSDPYIYEPLPYSSSVPNIRLVKLFAGKWGSSIQCSLQHVALKKEKVDDWWRTRPPEVTHVAVANYDALSYVWGDPADTVRIFIDGKQLNVTRNLDQALQHLRRPLVSNEVDSYYVRKEIESMQDMFWIDAICIDQTNLEERGQQVRIMAEIYSLSRQVVLWLGEEDQQSELAFSNISFMKEELDKDYGERLSEDDSSDSDSEPELGVPPKVNDSRVIIDWTAMRGQTLSRSLAVGESGWDAIAATFQRRHYWSRLWVVQEVCNAETITIQCGFLKLHWRDVYALFHMLSLDPKMVEKSHLNALQSVLRLEKLRKDFKNGDFERHSDALYAVENFGSRGCADSKDVIYGLQSISPVFVSEIFPDYSLCTADVYIAVARATLGRWQSLDSILPNVQRSKSKEARRKREQKNLPSWVPDWGTAVEFEEASTYYYSYYATGLLEKHSNVIALGDKDPRVLHLEGVHQEYLSQVSKRFEENDSVESRILQWLALDSTYSMPEGSTSVNALLDEMFDERPQKSYDLDVAGPIGRYLCEIDKRPERLRGWAMFRTNGRYKGLVLGDAQNGDKLFISHGSKMPLILRKAPNEVVPSYTFVGIAFVDGLMWGQGTAGHIRNPNPSSMVEKLRLV